MLWLAASTLCAQSRYTVTGTMIDSLSHEEVRYVTLGLVTADSTARTVAHTVSDTKGIFSFQGIPEGNYLLKGSLVGYDLLTMPVSVTGANQTITLGQLPMKKVSMTLQNVKIVGEKPIYMQDGEKTLYNVSEDPTIEGGTASDALQNAPGVEVDIEGNITLRGVSSVEIWINDKPSRLNADNLKEFIQQLPANAIERIEVITNPSARYSAKGTGGIINVVTTSKIKKNSFLSFGVRGSSKPDVSPWISYVFANDKLSLNFHLNGNYRVRKSSSEYSRTMFNDAFDTSSVIAGNNSLQNQNYSGGLHCNGSYEFDTLNTLSWWAGFRPTGSRSNANGFESRLELLDCAGLYEFNETTTSNNLSISGWGGLWYEHTFKNNDHHTLEANTSFNIGSNHSNTNYLRDYLELNNLDLTRLSTYQHQNYYVDAGLDYTLPYHKNGTISMGASAGFSHTIDLTRQDTLNKLSELFELDSLRLCHSLEKNGNVDAYLTIEHKFGNFTLKGGLRAEYENIDFQIFNSPNDNIHTYYFALFPSLHLSYRTQSMHNFKLSYSRRVSTPNASQLSTFISYAEDSYSTGNPDLTPTYTNSIEAGWTKFFRKFGNVGLTAYYKDSRDEISTLSDVAYSDVFNRIVTFTQPINAGYSYRTGADFNVTYRLKSFMNIRFYANLYYYHSEFMFRSSEKPQEVSTFNYSFRLNFWAKLWKVLEINASANYRSPTVSLFTTSRPGYSIDCGLRANFCKRKISVHLNVSDIFNWNKSISSSSNPYYTSSNTTRYNSRSINAGITFRFGKMELESKAKSSEETE